MELRRFDFHSGSGMNKMQDDINKALEQYGIDIVSDVISITIVPGKPNFQGPKGCDRYTVWYRGGNGDEKGLQTV